MLKVLGKSSSINVRKVLWCCAELELEYQHEQYGSGFESTTAPAFTAMNPSAMVPVIIDGDFILWESNTICRYLAARQQRHDLLPHAPKERALVEKWMDWQSTELNNSWRYAFMALVRKSATHRDSAAIDASVAEWSRHMQIVEDQLARTGGFIAGDSFTVADIVIGLSINRYLLTPIERPVFPAVAAYCERLSVRPGYRVHCANGIA